MCKAQWLLMNVRNHGGQNYERLCSSEVCIHFMALENNRRELRGRECCNWGGGLGWTERVKEKKPTPWYPSDILLIIDTRPCSHVPPWMVSSLTLLKNDRLAFDPYVGSESRWLSGEDKMQLYSGCVFSLSLTIFIMEVCLQLFISQFRLFSCNC